MSGVLAAGCRSSTAHGLAARTSANALPKPGPPASGAATDKVAQAHAHYAMAVIHEMDGEQEAALDEYYKAATNDSGNERLIQEVSRRFLQNKQPEKALELLARAAARPNASGAIFARLGLVYGQLGKYDQAVAAERTAIKRAPQSLSGYRSLFLTYVQGKQEQDAPKVLDAAARQPHTDANFLVGLSDLYLDLSQRFPAQKDKARAKALAVLNRAAKMNPPSPEVCKRMADSFAALNQTEKASQLYLEALKRLPEEDPLRERIHATLADFYLQANDDTHAREQLEAVIRDDPTNPQAYSALGSIALDEKKPGDAADYFSKSILLNPDFEQAYYDLALAQIELKKGGDALATLELARKKFPPSYALEMLTGMAFSAQKGYAEAIQHYIAAEVIAQATDPKRLNDSFYFQLGAAYERKGDYGEAEKYFEKSLQLAPDSPETLNYLGYMWAEHGMKLEKARALIEKAVKAEPKNAAFLDSLGWVLFKLNQPGPALENVRKAVELSDEPDPTVFDHLGDIYSALKQPDKAREAWRKSLSLEDNSEVRKKLETAPASTPPAQH
jgi:tetratricopeptide (TPR) repeat protein